MAAVRAALSPRKSGFVPPWTIPNKAWSSRECAARARSDQSSVRSIASLTTSVGAGSPTRWSSTMATSAPSRSCTATASSGVNRTTEPSYVEENVTPSSSIWGSSEKTWYPPESVSIGDSHPLNWCSPPSDSTTSSPGRSMR